MVSEYGNDGLVLLQRRLSGEKTKDHQVVCVRRSEHDIRKPSAMFKKFNKNAANQNEISLPLTKGVIRQPSTRHRKQGYTGDKIRINVSGRRYETRVSTLERFPNTLLGDWKQREIYFDSVEQEIFLDRDRQCFESILRFYQSGGILIKPSSIPDEIYYKEINFFELDKFIEKDIPSHTVESNEPKQPKGKARLMHISSEIWKLMEEPSSSVYAKIMSVISVMVIFISIWNFCIETLPDSKKMLDDLCVNATIQEDVVINGTIVNTTTTICTYDLWTYPFFIIETFCVIYFTLEVLVRFIVSPDKVEFCKQALNIIDVVSVIPYFVQIGFDINADGMIGGNLGTSEESFSSLIVLRILRLVRILRIFKLSRYFTKLQVLGKTLIASIGELAILVFFIFIAMIVFSTVVYFCEANSGPGNQFDSIPAAFWWAVVTMTTVGYGDIIPRTVLGKIVGFVCAITGVLCIALPVPAIVNNFVKQMEIMERKNKEKQVKSVTDELVATEINGNIPRSLNHGVSIEEEDDEFLKDERNNRNDEHVNLEV